jgi:transcription-repair coupling factor (superfamily II helicase)
MHLPITIKQLSKFTTHKDAITTKDGLTDGTVDIVIGTHALLADNIKFKNLGLVVIDEEQHFGVKQKEKLKKLKSNVHILSLSATPIPRTLQMSIIGLRDISIIATPPASRLPIKTNVMKFDPLVIREAILSEKARGGRVFYVTPRIAYLEDIQKKLGEIVPEAKCVIAHGAMSAAQLSEIMNDFYDGKYDVLISTIIIESGVDISIANTIIIDRAELFGLAQLYQVRGRVGRSNMQAYAYMLLSSTKPTKQALERLEAIKSLDTLGAGFSIASYDMDIRGYGNLVGEEQSGYVKDVGIELYQDMLKETIEAMQHETIVEDEWSPALNIGVSLQIPEKYVEDIGLRINLYKRIARLHNNEELEQFAYEMVDRFGPMPEEAMHLFEIMKLKVLAKSLYISKLDCGDKGMVISFRSPLPEEMTKLIIDLMGRNSHTLKLRPDGKLMVLIDCSERRIEVVRGFLEKLKMAE